MQHLAEVVAVRVLEAVVAQALCAEQLVLHDSHPVLDEQEEDEQGVPKAVQAHQETRGDLEPIHGRT